MKDLARKEGARGGVGAHNFTSETGRRGGE